MAVVPIVAPDDPRIADYRALRDGELLRGRSLFVAEGRLVVERVLRDNRYRVLSLLLNPASHEALDRAGLLTPDLIAYVCAPTAFRDITGVDVHRGCLGLVQRAPAVPWRDVVKGGRLVVVLEDATNADNVGGAFRNAAAFGADAVLLSPACCDPLYRKAVRTSMAAVLRVPYAHLTPWPEGLEELRAEGFTVAALSLRKPAIPLERFAQSPPDRLALLVGTEGAGLTGRAEAAADMRVRIPIRAEVDSLNLAVAIGIALSRLARGL